MAGSYAHKISTIWSSKQTRTLENSCWYFKVDEEQDEAWQPVNSSLEGGSSLFRDEPPNRLSNHKLMIVKDIYIQKTQNGYNMLYL